MGIDVSKIKKPMITEDEIKTCIKMGWDEGAITAEERQMLSRVFTLNDKTIGKIMVPRENMAILDRDATLEETAHLSSKTGFSRFPIRKEADPDIVGFIHAKDVFRLIEEKKPALLRK